MYINISIVQYTNTNTCGDTHLKHDNMTKFIADEFKSANTGVYNHNFFCIQFFLPSSFSSSTFLFLFHSHTRHARTYTPWVLQLYTTYYYSSIYICIEHCYNHYRCTIYREQYRGHFLETLKSYQTD